MDTRLLPREQPSLVSHFGPHSEDASPAQSAEESSPRGFLGWLRRSPYDAAGRESGYVALIPLSDARLRPRRTKLLISCMIALLVMAVTLVYCMVPRGVSVDWTEVQRQRMTWNATESTYSLSLRALVHVYNPNYVSASLNGSIGELDLFRHI